jgi:ketosteroid isomerase-like protein
MSAETPTGSDRAVALAFLQALFDLDMDRHFSFWAEDGVMEFPFQARGFPTRFAGREAIAAALGGMPGTVASFGARDMRLLATEEPGLFLTEWTSDIVVRVTGETHVQRYICLVRVKDGRVDLFREYNDPQVVAEAFGTR